MFTTKLYSHIFRQSAVLTTVLVLLVQPTRSDLPFDKSVCTPPKISALSPLPALGDVYSASIRWTSEVDKSIYDVRDDYDRRRGQAALTINMPRLPAAAKMIYDLHLGYISVIDDVTQRECTVKQPDASFHTYNNLPFLAGLTELTNNMESARDLQYLGEVTVNDVNTDHYSACLYDYVTNTTMLYNIYYVGRLGTASLTWQMPHVPKMDRSLPYIIKLYAKRSQNGAVQEYKVTGTVGRFNVNPEFEDTTFLPPPGTWCEGLPITSTPDLPASFSLLAEMVHLDAGKVSFQKIFFNSKRKLVRKDWKEISVDSTAVDSGPPYTTIYDFNNGVKYSIDRHLQSCEQVSSITQNDEFAEPAPQKRISPHEFRLAKPDLFFHTRNALVQAVGQRTVRGITTDVYIGQYPDPDVHRNFTVQWFFAKSHWQIYAGGLIESGALVRMEVYEVASGNPTVYNIIEFQNSEPDYDSFDLSPCYPADQKIHFLLLIRVLNPGDFGAVTPRLMKDKIIEILASLIREDNRFAGIQVEYDGGTNLYVYATLLDRSPVDNTDIQHKQPHGMEAAFLFLGGSVRSQIGSTITTPDGKNVTLIPTRLLRLNFAEDFTTQPSTRPTTTQTPPMPPRRTTSHKTTTTTQTSAAASTTTSSSNTASTPSCNPLTGPSPTPPNWMSCRPICAANNMCPCQSLPTGYTPPSSVTSGVTGACNCRRDCPTSSNSKGSQAGACGHFSGSQGQQQNSSASDITVAALVGAMFGTLALGLILGFVATRLYHVLKRLPDVRLVNSDDELRY